jgi:hypothetical protein
MAAIDFPSHEVLSWGSWCEEIETKCKQLQWQQHIQLICKKHKGKLSLFGSFLILWRCLNKAFILVRKFASSIILKTPMFCEPDWVPRNYTSVETLNENLKRTNNFYKRKEGKVTHIFYEYQVLVLFKWILLLKFHNWKVCRQSCIRLVFKELVLTTTILMLKWEQTKSLYAHWTYSFAEFRGILQYIKELCKISFVYKYFSAKFCTQSR